MAAEQIVLTVLIVSSFAYQAFIIYSLNKRVKTIDAVGGARIANLESFIDKATTSSDGSTSVYREYLKTLNGQEILKFVGDTMDNSFKPVKHDFSTSIIFNIGNLDFTHL